MIFGKQENLPKWQRIKNWLPKWEIKEQVVMEQDGLTLLCKRESLVR